ncbi:alternative ribosome rescue aminoacyl-tRNA hydrolase ArfB [Pseudohoeflea coraliihabitans]|uniref:Aminoacyl-tRNA hydrolase n=1 Tax=Pseudohoeflea coraliihabitans TaxID=2860393 RepID=A0ABS6WT27_9HYPH|nr:alternative ribosome rescue aminoacyl-tRNA hydrolase ArfB [Pseudohoeflea sp. DP4N28-3]MBW3099114.1 aminoacyl-tRNA hydrolase [Pseudohoeflea sp. DP4N28-3]
MSQGALYAARNIVIAGWELKENFIHSAGPGGQNVNKVATAVQLQFDIRQSPSLPERVKSRLIRFGGSRVSKEGVLMIEARRHRTQERNRADARDRLTELIDAASEPPPPPRRKTRPSRGAVERRLKSKSIRADIKKGRGRIKKDD